MSENADQFDDMDVAQLHDHLRANGIEYRSDDRKADLQAMARGQERPERTGTGDDAGASQVAEKLGKEQEQGFQGTVPDETPNSAYTVAGRLAGEPTPEDLNPTNPSQ